MISSPASTGRVGSRGGRYLINLLLQVNNNRTAEWGPYWPPRCPAAPSWGGRVPDPHILLCCNCSAGLASPVCRTVVCSFEYFQWHRHTRTGHRQTPHWPSPKVRHLMMWVLWKKWRWRIDEAPVWFAPQDLHPCHHKTAPARVPSLGKMYQNRCHCGKLGTFKGLWYSHSSALCISPPLRVCASAHLFIAPHWQKRKDIPWPEGNVPVKEQMM